MMPNFSRALLEEVLPRVEAAYHVARSRDERAIAGLSMGGAQAVFVGLRHLETFASVASFSGAFNMWPGLGPVETGGAFGGLPEVFPQLDRRVNTRLRLLWLSCGADDLLIGVHDRFADWLRGRGVRFTGTTVPGYGHAWTLWRRNLADLAPRLFR
jgi:enterochelin esterase family protein